MKFIENKTKILQILLIIGIAVGVFLRFNQFGRLPLGLQNDEASIAYEAFSLSETGKDRWGYQHPVYFIAWGSGQNTLYAYCSIPIIKLLGFDVFSVRLLSGIFGLLTLIFVYLLLKEIYKNQKWALVGTLIYTFNPWHFVLSRWSFEENQIPFFIICGLYLLIKSQKILSTNKELRFSDKLIILVSWLPFGIMFYAYAMSLFIVPVFFALFLALNYKQVLQNIKLYLGTFSIFFISSLPFFLFILKNNVLKKKLFFEDYLPFSLPKMLYDRDTIIKSLPDKIREIYEAFKFLFRSFADRNMYNATALDVPHFFIFLALIGVIFSIIQFRNNKNFKYGILLAWLISSFGIYFLFFMNLNRSMHFQSIIPIFITIGLVQLVLVFDKQTKKYFIVAISTIFIFMTSVFMIEYFVKYPQYSSFVTDYDDALYKAESFRKNNENIAVTPTLIQNYLYTAVYSKFPPAQFQKSDWKHANNRPYVYSFGHYYMLGTIEYYTLDVYQKNIDYLYTLPSAIFILKNTEKPLDGHSALLYSNKFWAVYRCSQTKNFKWNRN